MNLTVHKREEYKSNKYIYIYITYICTKDVFIHSNNLPKDLLCARS
jgi:hypothetical protein